MKLLLVIVLFGAFVAGQAEDMSALVGNTDYLFETAWEYQNKLSDLQNDINQDIIEVRIAVSTALRGSTNKTLEQVNNNADVLWAGDSTVRANLNKLLPDGCVSDLMEILNGLTHMSGFESSNCLKHYDNSVQEKINRGNEILKEYGTLSSDVQQSVVQSFIGSNAFKDPNSIIEKIIKNFKDLEENWNVSRPDVEKFITELANEILGLNNQLGQCFNILQIEYDGYYTAVNNKRTACEEFNRSAKAVV